MTGTSASRKDTDPYTHILWGLALMVGGGYMLYISSPFTYEWNLVLLSISQSLGLIAFGLFLVARGIRRERQRKKR